MGIDPVESFVFAQRPFHGRLDTFVRRRDTHSPFPSCQLSEFVATFTEHSDPFVDLLDKNATSDFFWHYWRLLETLL